MPASPSTVFELRQYTLHPGRRDELIELFEREFIKTQEAEGIELIGLFRDADRSDRFVWLRGFSDMAERERALEGFYGGPVWAAHRDAANATMIDSDNVLLLRAVGDESGLLPIAMRVRSPLLCLTYSLTDAVECDAFVERFQTKVKPQLANQGASVLATFVTESSQNTYPRLPVREGEHNVVVILDGIDREQLALHAGGPVETLQLIPTRRSRVQYAP